MDKCKHIMKSGPNRGQKCGKRTTSEGFINIPYCFTHKDKHMDEIEPYVQAQREEEFKQRADAKERFEHSLEPRHIDYKEVVRLSKLEDEDVQIDKHEGEEEVDPIIRKVDEICLTSILAYKIIRPMGMLDRFRVYPSMYAGFTKEDIKAEFVKRGFAVTFRDNNILMICLVYVPDW